METMTIGRLAKEARVNIDTLRYYEKRGLLPEPPRKESGYRLYSPDAVRRIALIMLAKERCRRLRHLAGEGGEMIARHSDRKGV